ncbi:hypothetical protein CXB51_035846 [Gossypium anomalum]|uniref:Uncharacterized protein n=1 Tax=Gossypium anomalum TaxID=47600 RepID=A0A8J6CJU7_9ROSI|nr:hypothetical protein CXB51_035846 [Gossypium anomalum]
MCCFIIFSLNKLESTIMEVPRQILHLPGKRSGFRVVLTCLLNILNNQPEITFKNNFCESHVQSKLKPVKNCYRFGNHHRMNQDMTLKPQTYYKSETARFLVIEIPASTLIFTHPCGGGIHLTMDLDLGCFRFNALPRYSKPKPLIKSNNPEQHELMTHRTVDSADICYR